MRDPEGIKNEDGYLIGRNTDAEGSKKAILKSGYTISGRDVLILGAGGAARALSYGLANDVNKITIVNRNESRAEKLAKKFNKPFIVTQHNTWIDYKSWLNVIENLNDLIIGKSVLKLADKILTVSKETKKYVLRLGADPKITSVMYNGVDTTCFRSIQKMESRIKLSLPTKQKIVFSVRRLVYKNGLDTLIESV